MCFKHTHPYIIKHKLFLTKLDLLYNVNYFSIGILYKLMHHFYWYFTKREKFRILSLNRFYFQLVLTPILYDEKYFILVYANIFNMGINNLKLVLFSVWYPYCIMVLMFTQKFSFYFQLVSCLSISINW